MTLFQILVTLFGGLAVVTLNVWFFPRRGSAAAASVGSDVVVVVDGGYAPSAIRARRGQLLRLVFDRRDEGSCSEEVVFPDFGVRRFLPPHEKTVVELTPERAGAYDFTCGMGMLRGRLVVEDT